jgi:hypothetical protein
MSSMRTTSICQWLVAWTKYITGCESSSEAAPACTLADITSRSLSLMVSYTWKGCSALRRRNALLGQLALEVVLQQ